MAAFIARKRLYLFTCLLFLSISFYAQSDTLLNEKKVIAALQKHYGERAVKRGKAWLEIISSSQQQTDLEKLAKVNQFFNLLHFVDDSDIWGDKNYWATPIEFIGANAGDCEDFAIAKYFTLLEMGIEDSKMRLTMVKALKLNQYHMVLSYYDKPSSIPLILDNIDGEIKLADSRPDLFPIYSFNGKQLWLNKEKGQGVVSGASDRITRWKHLNQRMGISQLRKSILSME
ncbi:MAG: transglutaminase-like cysteine peptidase [Psychromonas sp.]